MQVEPAVRVTVRQVALWIRILQTFSVCEPQVLVGGSRNVMVGSMSDTIASACWDDSQLQSMGAGSDVFPVTTR